MMMTFKILAFCFLLWVVALISLPYILNSSQGQRFAINQLQKAVPGSLSIKSLDVTWQGPQRLREITYQNPEKKTSAQCKEIEIENSFLSFLIPGTWLYNMKIIGAQAEIQSKNNAPLKINNLQGNLNFKANILGHKLHEIALELKGDEGSISLFGSDNNGTFILQKPLEASVVTTSDIGKQILQHFLPFINGVIKTDRPLSIEIASQGFALPLHKLQWKNLQFGRAKIDLGKITVQNSGPITKVIKILAPDNPREINLWMTPAYLSMANGTVYLERLDILAMNKFPLAAWGKVDLVKDTMKMTLGIASKVLKGIIDIPAILDREMFLLPITGSLKDADIDTNRLKASVGQMAIQLLGKLTKSSKSDSKDNTNDSNENIPPPTTQPLPWE